jgi:hypothetical protein
MDRSFPSKRTGMISRQGYGCACVRLMRLLKRRCGRSKCHTTRAGYASPSKAATHGWLTGRQASSLAANTSFFMKNSLLPTLMHGLLCRQGTPASGPLHATPEVYTMQHE